MQITSNLDNTHRIAFLETAKVMTVMEATKPPAVKPDGRPPDVPGGQTTLASRLMARTVA